MKLRLILSVLLLTSIACTGSKNASDQPTDTAIIGLNSKPATLDPLYARDASGQRILNLMFHSFVKIGPKLAVVGDAASKWEWKKNRLHLWIPKGLKFHDGSEMSKDDLEYTFQAYQKKDCPFRSSLEDLKKVVINEQEKQWQIVLEFSQFSATFLTSSLPLIRILPKSHSEKSSQEFSENPNGSGAYKFVSSSQNSLKLERSGPKTSTIAKLEFKFIADEYTLLNKLKKGSVHLVQNDLPKEKIPQLMKEKNLQVITYPGVSFTYLLVNFKNSMLEKKKLRSAIAMSIDRNSLIEQKLASLASPATGLLTPSTQFFNQELEPTDFNLSKAQKIIEELGLKGKKITLKTSSQRSARDNGFVLSEFIKRSGLEVDLVSREWSSFFDSVQKGQFDLATMRWVGAVDPDLYRIAFHSKELPPGRNRGHYQNPELDRLLEEGLRITDPKARKEHYYKVQKIVFEDLAVIPLWYDHQVAVIHKSLKNYEPVPNSDFSPILKAKLD